MQWQGHKGYESAPANSEAAGVEVFKAKLGTLLYLAIYIPPTRGRLYCVI